MNNINKNKELEKISKTISKCEKCSLHLTRNHAVPGEGNVDAPIVFVGEGPGADEDSTGKPFVGKAGKLLDKMLKDWAGINRKDIYITNIVKCRPPKNRIPTDEEMKSCVQYLESQMLIIKPKIIVTLGATSMSYFTNEKKISESRGKFYNWYGNIKIFVTFHPSYLLRNHSMEKGSPRWYSYLDMKAIGVMFRALQKGKNVDEVVSAINNGMKESGGI